VDKALCGQDNARASTLGARRESWGSCLQVLNQSCWRNTRINELECCAAKCECGDSSGRTGACNERCICDPLAAFRKVNGESASDDAKFTEADIAAPYDPYSLSKYEAEQILSRVAAEAGLEVVIVRPPSVYRPGVKGNFAQILKVPANSIPPPLASVHNQRS
jgi:hypothetical protein